MSAALGFICVGIAVLAFGSALVPVKQYEMGDGFFFQHLMCQGIWVMGLIVQLWRGAKFQPFAMTGG